MRNMIISLSVLALLTACGTTSQIPDSGPAKQVTNSLQYGGILATNGAGDKVPAMSGQDDLRGRTVATADWPLAGSADGSE